MTASTTMTIRLAPEVKEKLGRLALDTRRSKSFLAAEAVGTYVDRELAIVEGVQRGLADIKAGRIVSHEEAMTEIQTMIDAVTQGGE